MNGTEITDEQSIRHSFGTKYEKLKSYDVRTGKMGLREVNDFRVGSILIDDAASFGVTTR